MGMLRARSESSGSLPRTLLRRYCAAAIVHLFAGRNFHFWPTKAGKVTIDSDDIAGLASAFRARLAIDDAALPDDRARARFLGSCGGDYWRSLDAPWKADWSSNGDWAIGRFRLVTRDWQIFTATTVDAATLKQNPHPRYP